MAPKREGVVDELAGVAAVVAPFPNEKGVAVTLAAFVAAGVAPKVGAAWEVAGCAAVV